MTETNYSFGIGDRFGLQGIALLRAFKMAEQAGVIVSPVWNKSFREHSLVNSNPSDVRIEADKAVDALGWPHPYYVDADHITSATVDAFLEVSDFFTIDVADKIGNDPGKEAIEDFIARNSKYLEGLKIPGIEGSIFVNMAFLEKTAKKFVQAAIEAGNIFERIRKHKNGKAFIAEVSMDEVDRPQQPAELFFILGELAHRGVTVDNIAPRFTGSFHKGVDYTGDINAFAKEFEEDLMVVAHAQNEFGIPGNLRLSVHSGSDKFSIYPVINKLIRKHKKGLHLKTAGTTWLEEFAGLLTGNAEALDFAKYIYGEAITRKDELLKPYLMVTNIRLSLLPAAVEINSWSAEEFSHAIIHDEECKNYNPDLRQFIHLAYKIAAENLKQFKKLVTSQDNETGNRVTENIFNRHIKPLFIDQA